MESYSSKIFVKEAREYLVRELNIRIKRRPLYSQRAFARDIGISPSSLNEYLNGRMKLSKGRVAIIAKKIGLTTEQKNHWLDLMLLADTADPDTALECKHRINARFEAQKNSITVDQFKIIADWYHLAFLELVQMNAKKYSDLKYAAKVLGISKSEMNEVVQRLQGVGLLKTTEQSTYCVDNLISIGDTIPSEAIRRYHKQILEKAIIALDTQDKNKRFSSSTIVALPKQQVESLSSQLQKTAIEFLTANTQKLDISENNVLYCLSIHFFDLLNEIKK